jgi:hypothetical protein
MSRFLKHHIPDPSEPEHPEVAALLPAATVAWPAAPAGFADSTWLAWPTLSEIGGGQVKTAGVHYHEQEIRQLAQQTGRLVMAELRIQADGKYAGAVRVHVAGIELGSIPHGSADDYRAVIHRLNERGERATCRAELDADPGDEYVDVWLSGKAKERADDEPFLPPMLGAGVLLADGETDRLQSGLGTRAQSKRVVRIGELTEVGGRWIVTVDDRTVGTLPDGDYPRLAEAQAAGLPLTCRVRVVRTPNRPLRVEADFPRH